MVKLIEPTVNFSSPGYEGEIGRALTWFHSEIDKKEARGYLRNYIIQKHGRDPLKIYDRVPEHMITATYGWLARLFVNGSELSEKHVDVLNRFVQKILTYQPEVEKEEPIKQERPGIQDYLKEKINEYLGTLEGALDDYIFQDKEFDFAADLRAKEIPGQYCVPIHHWIKQKVQTFIEPYESSDAEVQEAYSNIPKKKLVKVIKLLMSWDEEIGKYYQIKKANRKPRATKTKSPTAQVSKLNYLKEFAELSLKSIVPTEIVGASQLWVYNTKNKRLSVYKTDSSRGLQVKGSTLQNYEPDMCDQKALRKPKEVINEVLAAGKIKLRTILSNLTTKSVPVNGRINKDCILLKAIK